MMITKQDRVVKTDWNVKTPMTSWGGLALPEALARKTRLWSDCEKLVPKRGKGEWGYSSVAVASAVIHGLLSGGQGTVAGEGLRGDEPLMKMLGLKEGAPEEATVNRALAQWAEKDGAKAFGQVQRLQVRRLLEATSRPSLLFEGFFPIFGDGTNLEVERDSKFEGKKTYDGTSKLVLSALWTGPYCAGQTFAKEKEGEAASTLRLIPEVWSEVVQPLGLDALALFLLDSLYGDGPCLDALEACEGAAYVVGANKIPKVAEVAADQPQTQWLSKGANPKRGWSRSALCVHWFQSESWPAKRTVVTRRYKRKGEMIWSYASVFTNLTPAHPLAAAMMKRLNLDFGSVVFLLYDHKQAMENQFKDGLSDLGLHHPPCGKLASNEVFYAVAALALNLAIGVRRIAMTAEQSRMRLWRLRREFFALAARVTLGARQALVMIHSADVRIRGLWEAAIQRLAAA